MEISCDDIGRDTDDSQESDTLFTVPLVISEEVDCSNNASDAVLQLDEGCGDDSSTNNHNHSNVDATLNDSRQSGKQRENPSPGLSASSSTSSKRPRHKPSERRELLRLAVSDVLENKISMRRAAQKYNLAKSSLCDYVRKNGIDLPGLRFKIKSSGGIGAGASKSDSNVATVTPNSNQPRKKPSVTRTVAVTSSARIVAAAAAAAAAAASVAAAAAAATDITEASATKRPSSTSASKHIAGPRPIAPKVAKIESPWNHTYGLPTQVPLSSWGTLGTAHRDVGKLKPLTVLPKEEPNYLIRPDFYVPIMPLNDSPEEGGSPVASTPIKDKQHQIRAEEILRKGGSDTQQQQQQQINIPVSPYTLNLVEILLNQIRPSVEPPSSPPQTEHQSTMASQESLAKGLISFINKSPSPFHAVRCVRDLLLTQGFRELREDEPWQIRPNDRLYVTKNESTIMAITVGGHYQPGNGFSMIGAHTDSPCLKLKPISNRTKEGYIQLGVETYGGGLWYTWFDRDLTVAGRCIVKRSDQQLEHHLVHLDRPIARVPSLAIHLDRQVNDGFAPNKEQHLSPVLCTTLLDQISRPATQTGSGAAATLDSTAASLGCSGDTKVHRHPSALMQAVANQLGVQEEDIIDLELCLADTQPACIGGIHNEFIFAPRLDNLFNSYTSILGLVESLPTLDSDTHMRLACLYDNEEVGSVSTQGAESTFTATVLRRLTAGVTMPIGTVTSPTAFEEALSKSYLISADQAHAVHPNWDDKHERCHRPRLHGGIVLKTNASQRYASNALTAAVLREIAALAEVPLQEFAVRQDAVCGSTIGPLMACKLGIPTVDVGGPQLSMHSCREMACVTSVGQAIQLYKTFYEQFPRIRDRIRIV